MEKTIIRWAQGIKLQCLLDGPHGGFQVACLEQCDRQENEIIRFAWREFEGVPRERQGLRQVSFCPHRLAETQIGLGNLRIEFDGTRKLGNHLIDARDMPLTGQSQPKIDKVEPGEMGPRRPVVGILTKRLLQILASSLDCLRIELIFRNAAQRQLVNS